jgi:hypothetical protein
VSEKLRECPFCGAVALFVGPMSPGRDIYCRGCGATVAWLEKAPGESLAAWNRRAESSELSSLRRVAAALWDALAALPPPENVGEAFTNYERSHGHCQAGDCWKDGLCKCSCRYCRASPWQPAPAPKKECDICDGSGEAISYGWDTKVPCPRCQSAKEEKA